MRKSLLDILLNLAELLFCNDRKRFVEGGA